jgi:hypothetical protein
VPNAQATVTFGVNDLSQIVGTYWEESGARGFLATPQKK